MTSGSPRRIDIWHNILWSRYKGAVFSALHKRNDPHDFDIRFFQIAETDGNRATLSSVDESYHRYPYTLLFKGSFSQIAFWKRLEAVVRLTLKSDANLSILTGYERPETWLQLLIVRLKGKKAFIFCDSTIFDQPQTFLKGILKHAVFRFVDGVFGYGERARDYALHYGTPPSRWHKRCQAAALPHDYNAETALAERLRSAAPIDKPRFLYVGRLSPEKNLERLLEAFAKVLKNLPHAELAVIGNGPEKTALQEKAKALGLDPQGIILGSKSGADLFAEYARATCFVLPSLSEPWGLVVNEALHYGCPVIVSDRCGCVPELVIEGETGFCHKAFDTEDLAAKMLAAPSHFSDTKKSASACIALMQGYTPETAAKEMLEGMKSILER